MSDLAKKLAGRFIVLDGPDGSGKSTQLALLADWLAGKGVDVITACDPGGTDVGEQIRAILLDRENGCMSPMCEMLLFMASRAQLIEERVRPALESGKVVLCDRFISATVAYQGAAGINSKTIIELGDTAVAGLWPDLTVILDLPADAGLGRILKKTGDAPVPLDRMESKKLAFHQKVREIFLDQAGADPARYAVVDGSGTEEQIHQRLGELLERWNFA
ncbi:MAG: dTMP kinase [Phycisphaerae bacterium]|nr:dTMP kinase [Phycisphaerae bacterium]